MSDDPKITFIFHDPNPHPANHWPPRIAPPVISAKNSACEKAFRAFAKKEIREAVG